VISTGKNTRLLLKLSRREKALEDQSGVPFSLWLVCSVARKCSLPSMTSDERGVCTPKDTPDIQALVFGELTLSDSPSPSEHATQEAQLAALHNSVASRGSRSQGPPTGPRQQMAVAAARRQGVAPPNPTDRPERSVRLSAVNSGGQAPVRTDPRYRRP